LFNFKQDEDLNMTKAISFLGPDVHFKLLHLLELEPELRQRELAQKLGISLGSVNYCLKALIEIGHIKAGKFTKNSDKSIYLYTLTAKGVAEKAELTAGFLSSKLIECDLLKQEIESIQFKTRS
jgi:MarR family transcriptional regulator, temperature-dependent positive regulator of motility